ncbi:ATP-binding protein [Sphingomonas sp. LY54]|uniref:ATP-binding protein n=1 Tax=Sphingomonas sp. LY54 TaxID=3095343 RepID=UPI002D771879|nr:ATP-binding protein [Sphingomonas sp. LY54]WRP27621.1 ATP-binding protein [Sphingomonas sp. LY54]
MEDPAPPEQPDGSLPGFDDETLYEDAPCGYVATLPDGTVVRVNRTFLRWTGYAAEELCGTRLQEKLTLAGRIYHETHFAPLLRMQGAVREVALDFVCKSGDRLPTLVNTIQRVGEDGQPVVNLTTIFDARDRRQYEQELLAARDLARRTADELQRLNAELEQRVTAAVEERMRAEEALRQSQKMEAIGQLTGGVAHDFNNLLTLVIGGLDLIDRQLPSQPAGPGTDRIRRARDTAMEGARRAAKLTQHLLAFARRQPLQPRVLEVNRLVAEISDMLRRTIGEQVALEAVLGAGLWSVEADPMQLENAILNLAVNARDAMPEGGKLTIETHNANLDDAYVAGIPEGLPPGQYVLIAVSDTGSGMGEETRQKVFEPFFTTKEAGKGTGLGLSQVYGFVRQSGGHVRIYSELSVGTCVKIYLPRTGLEAVPAEANVRQDPAAFSGDETILVVEDQEELRKYIVGILSELGYQVVGSATGSDALKVIAERPDLDLLLTDVVLPGGMNGRELSVHALRLRPDLKLLFMTGYTQNAIVHDGRLDADVALISKPFTFDQLAAKVRAQLDGYPVIARS